MRRVARLLLLLFAFTIPWEYSLDMGESLGNIARVTGLLLLLIAVLAVLQAGRLRAPRAMVWLVLAFYLWFCCTYFWTIEPLATINRMRGLSQETMVVWLVWEFAESSSDLRNLMRATVAGSCVLALLTLADFASAQAIANQVRFVAEGQDPNDVARFLDLGFPLAALLFNSERRWTWRFLAAAYLPLGMVSVLLTASRGGFLAAMVALAASSLLLVHDHPKRLVAGTIALPPFAAILWMAVPRGTLERLATINEQLQRGDLNQRMNIWQAGWHAFVRAPWFGTGAGSFVSAAGLAPIDTAHNTILSIAVTGGLVALFIAAAIVALAIGSISQTSGPLKWALATSLLVWVLASLVATVEENRITWLLLAIITLAGRLAEERHEELAECFPSSARSANLGTQPLIGAANS